MTTELHISNFKMLANSANSANSGSCSANSADSASFSANSANSANSSSFSRILCNSWQIQWHASNEDLQVSKHINKNLQVSAIHTNQALQVNAMPRSARKLHAKQHLLVHGMPIKLWAKMNDMPTKGCQSINGIVRKT